MPLTLIVSFGLKYFTSLQTYSNNCMEYNFISLYLYQWINNLLWNCIVSSRWKYFTSLRTQSNNIILYLLNAFFQNAVKLATQHGTDRLNSVSTLHSAQNDNHISTEQRTPLDTGQGRNCSHVSLQLFTSVSVVPWYGPEFSNSTKFRRF